MTLLETKGSKTSAAAAAEQRDVGQARDDRSPFFNRELSWLEFNSRVLDEAMDASWPVLERLKFLSIFSTNLDEFYMIRLSGLKEQLSEGIMDLSPDGRNAAQQLDELKTRLAPLLTKQSE